MAFPGTGQAFLLKFSNVKSDVEEGSGVAERNAATEYMYNLLGYLWEINYRQCVSNFFPIPFVRKCQSFAPYQHALHALTVALYSQSLLSLLVD